jgi:Zn-dependent protease with chaperone function
MRTAWILVTVLILSLLSGACETSSSQRTPQYPPPQSGAPGQYPPGAQQPGQPPPAGQAAPPATSQPPGTGAPAQYAPVLDPINNVDVMWLRNRAQSILLELIAALDPGPKQRVTGIPLVVDDTVGEVNAFAACTENGKAAMAISDGLLDIEAHLAQAKATDELFGSRKTEEYIKLVAANQRPQQPIVRPPLGFFDATQHLDPRKVSRQHELFDEQLAFVLGHEMGHHYLGHLPCTAAGGPLNTGEIGMLLSGAIPAFNQPNEVAADLAGTNNVLNAGARRQGYRWTEGGALLTMQFFAGIDQFSPLDIVFGFERSHPPPLVRRPIIQQAANAWRASGGRSLPIP